MSTPDDAHVEQQTGSASPSTDGGGDVDGSRQVGITAAVERGPAETTSDVESPPDVDDRNREFARSTDDL